MNSDKQTGQYRFKAAYSETVTLSDGTPVTLRLVRPEDKERLAAGLAKLSPESRYRRFLYAKDHLTPAELKYLTEVDNVNHFAIVALAPGQEPQEGYGIARFIRLPGEADVAEAAVAVLDEVQGKGLGGMLLRRLSEAALERGVTHFRATILEANSPVWRLLDEAAVFETELEKGGGYVVVDIPLAAPAKEDEMPYNKRLLPKLLSEAARGSLVIKRFMKSGSQN